MCRHHPAPLTRVRLSSRQCCCVQALAERIRGECREEQQALRRQLQEAQQDLAIKASLADSWQREVQGLCKRLEQARPACLDLLTGHFLSAPRLLLPFAYGVRARTRAPHHLHLFIKHLPACLEPALCGHRTHACAARRGAPPATPLAHACRRTRTGRSCRA